MKDKFTKTEKQIIDRVVIELSKQSYREMEQVNADRVIAACGFIAGKAYSDRCYEGQIAEMKESLEDVQSFKAILNDLETQLYER